MAQVDNSLFGAHRHWIRQDSSIKSWLSSISKTFNGRTKANNDESPEAVVLNPVTTEEQISYRTRWAREIVKNHMINEVTEANIQFEKVNWTWLMPGLFFDRASPRLPRPPSLACVPRTAVDANEPIRICIIGSGISGLFLGMLLDSLQLPEISYEILESSQRTGGRVYSHHFGPKKKDYYDVGAMRFPKIAPLARTFDLFDRCGIELLPYHNVGRMCPMMFNGVFHLPDEHDSSENDSFLMGISKGGMVPDRTVAEGPGSILDRAFAPFFTRLAHNFQEGFVELMKYDHMTTREYLREIM